MSASGQIAIRAEGLGKRFRIGEDVPYRTLRESLVRAFSGPSQRGAAAPHAREIWALRDVSFEVRRGEVVGVIGRNGAGKSTLLKLLARITSPSEGRAEIRGRVGSLLEVGTGFHPELTGRENIFLNGAILGMKRAEIRERFDEIVDFSEIGAFLDTPVKRYSSGMRVRLAFAVAAHLEPEILIIDEVLAVGDAAFQSRCLGKMNAVAGSGRTVFFVSHNMSAVGALCSRAISLDQGQIRADGAVDPVISGYLASLASRVDVPLSERSDRGGNGALRFTRLRLLSGEDETGEGRPQSGRRLRVALGYRTKASAPLRNARFAVLLTDAQGRRLFACDTRLVDADFAELPTAGEVVCEIPSLPLAAGRYELNVWATVSDEVADHVEHAGDFEVAEGDFFGTGRVTVPQKHGPYVVAHDWRFAEIAS